MQISGLNYRSFFEQTGLSFDLTASLNNLSGSGEFGFSGENNQINFKFNSGRIYDFEDRYVFSYLKDVNFQISGNISPDNYSYYINNYPTCFNGIKNNFKVQNFYVKTDQYSILDINLKIYGDTPNYDIAINDQYFIDSFLTGIINNKSLLDFRIFSGEITEPSSDFSIVTLPQIVSGINESNIVFQPNTGEGVYNLTLNLYTDFGLISRNFITTGRVSSLADMIFLLSPESFYVTGKLDFPYLQINPIIGQQDYSFSHRGVNAVGEDYYGFTDDILFEYHSGYLGIVSGNLLGGNSFSTGINTGIFYGTGTIQLTLTGLNTLTGINLSGGSLTGYNLASTGSRIFQISGSGERFIYFNLTGLGFINYSGIRPLFGDYSSDFNVTGTGLASGYLINSISDYILTGTSKILYPDYNSESLGGQYITGSGTYLFYTSGVSGMFTGYAIFFETGSQVGRLQKHYLSNTTGYFLKTEYITGLREILVTGNSTGLATGYANTFFTNSGFAIYSGTIVNTGYLNEINFGNVLATGIYSGDVSRLLRTGVVNLPSYTGFIFTRPGGVGLLRYIPDPFYMTATGIYFNTGYNIYSEGFSNYSGLFYNSSGDLAYRTLNGVKTFNFGPTITERDNLLLISDENPTTISGLYYRFQGTNYTPEATTGSWINKIKKFNDIYYVLGDFTLVGPPLGLTSSFNLYLMSGENLVAIYPETNSLSSPDGSYAHYYSPYDCHVDGTGLYIRQTKTLSVPTGFNVKDLDWQPKLRLSSNININYGNSSYSSNAAQIFGIFPDQNNQNLYMIGNFTRTENTSGDAIESEIFFKSVNSSFAHNKIIKVDKIFGNPVASSGYYLDYIGEKIFKEFITNDKDQNTNSFIDYNESVFCYYQSGNKLYLGGSFNIVGDLCRGGMAVYNKSGQLQPVDISISTFMGGINGKSIDHSINSVITTGNHIFIGGSISTFGGRRKYENDQFVSPDSYGLIKLNNPINIDRKFLPVKLTHAYNVGLMSVKDIKKYNNNIYVGGTFTDYLQLNNQEYQYYQSQRLQNEYERTGLIVLNQSGELIKNLKYNFIGTSTSQCYLNTIFITGSTGYFGGDFTGLSIDTNKTKRYNLLTLDLENNIVLPPIYDSPEGEVLSIGHFNQDWIESKNEFNPNAEIIEDKLNTIIIVGSFDTLYSGYEGNTTTNRWYPNPNGLLFIDANNPGIRYSGLRTGMRVIKYLSSGVISTGNNFEQFNHRDIIRLKNYNLNNTFNFVYGTGVDYNYSSTTYNDYGEIRFRTLNDIATYINNLNSLTISSPPNWSNLYNNFTGILESNSLRIRYKTSGTHSGDFPFISLDHIGLGLFEKTFSISEGNQITGENDPAPSITKKYIGDFSASTKTGDIIVVGNSNWKNQTTNIPSGAVYIYKDVNNNFELIKILSGSGHGIQNISYYGFNGDINYDGSIIAVGAQNFRANRVGTNTFQTTGIVDIYSGTNNDWNLDQRLSGIFSGLGTGRFTSNYFTGRSFGKSLSLDYYGDRIAISDVLKRQTETGSNIHIFKHVNNQWDLENVINTSPYDLYDIKLNDYGNILAIGQSSGIGGSIKVITKTGLNWNTARTGEVFSESPNNQIYLGASIDMNSPGNTIVAGAPNAINDGINCGAVFVYTGMLENWSQVAKITGANLVVGERFGHSVAINDDATIISVFSKNATTGKNYIFTGFESNWKQYQEISGFSGTWTGLSGNYISPDITINKNININSSGNLLLIGDSVSGIVKRFNLPFQSKPKVNQFDGGYEERYVTFRYPTSNSNYNDFYGYERLNDNYYYLYGNICDNAPGGVQPLINNFSRPGMSSSSGNSIILINGTGGWDTGNFDVYFGNNYTQNNVFTAKVFKNKLYVGGNFSQIAGTGYLRNLSDLACLDTGNGQILSPFSGFALDSDVLDINIWNDNLLIVGAFDLDSNSKILLHGFMVADDSGRLSTSYNFATSNPGINKIYVDENNDIYLAGRRSSIQSSNGLHPTIFPRNTGRNNTSYAYDFIFPIICLNKTPSGYEIPYNDFNKNLPTIANCTTLSSPSQFLGNTVNSYVSTIITGESGFYIGGLFNNINGYRRYNAALIGYDGSLKEWAPIFDGPIYDMVKSGDEIFIAGDFSDVNVGWGTANIVQIKAYGRADNVSDINQDFDPIIDTTNESYNTKIISKIFLDSGYIYIGGTFKTVNFPAITKVSFAAFDQAGNHVPALTQNISITNNPSYPYAAPEVRCIEKINDIFLLGGYFDYVNGQNITDFVPIRLDGTIVPFPSGLIAQASRTYNNNSIISDIKVTGNYVYLVGTSLSWFTDKNNEGGGRLGGACRLIYTGERFIIDKNWSPAFELNQNATDAGKYSARKMIIDEEENSYIFGGFRKAGYYRPGICELENEEITNFNPLIDLMNGQSFVKEITAYDNNHLIIGGSFSRFASTGNTSGTTGKSDLAIINLNNSEVKDWGKNFEPDGEVRTILVDQEKNQIHIGGRFNKVGSKPFDNLVSLDYQSGNQIVMRPYIVNNDKNGSSIFVNSIIRKDDNSLFIGGKIGNTASYTQVSGDGILSSGTGFYNDYIPVATGMTFVSGLYTGFLRHTGLNQKDITGKFLFPINLIYASGLISTGISGSNLTPTNDAFINNIIISNATSGGNDNYKRLSGGFNQFTGNSVNYIRYSGDLNTWLLYTGSGFNTVDALYKSDDLITWQDYSQTWDGDAQVGYSDYYYSGFKPNDIFILSHRNSNNVWPFIFGVGSSFDYSDNNVDALRRIKFNSLSGLNRYINQASFGGYYGSNYMPIYNYYYSQLITETSGERLLIVAKSTGANYPDTTLYHYGSGYPGLIQLSGENDNPYLYTNLTLTANPSLKTTNIFTPITGVQSFVIGVLTGETNKAISGVTGLWLSTGYINQYQNFNIVNSNSGYYTFSGNFTGLPISGRLISKNDMDLIPYAPFTGYSTAKQIVSGAQTAYVFSGQVYQIITNNTIFSGEIEVTGMISGTVTGTTPDGFIYHIATGIPYIFDSGDIAFFSGIKLIPGKQIFSGEYSNLITGLGELSGRFFYTGLTGINLTGTGLESFISSGQITGSLQEYNPIFNQSFAREVFSSGIYENKFTGTYAEIITVSGFNGPFYATGFSSEGLITGVPLYDKTFTGAFDIQTGLFLSPVYKSLPIVDENTYASQINVINELYSPISINVRYKSYFDKDPLVAKLSLLNFAQGRSIVRYITGEII